MGTAAKNALILAPQMNHSASASHKDTSSSKKSDAPFTSRIPERPWKRFDIIMSTICLNMFALVLPIVILQLYNRIIPNQALGTLSILAFGVGIVVALEAVIRIARSYIIGWISQQFEYSASSNTFYKLMNARLSDLNKIGVGEHMENLESLAMMKEFLAGQSLLIFLDMPFLFFFLGLIYYFGGYTIAMASVVVLVCFVIISVHLGRKVHHQLEERHNIGDRKYSFLVELLSNYYTIKALGMEELFLRRFERIQTQSSFIDYKINLYSNEARHIGSLFSSILFGTIIYFAGQEVILNHISMGAMAACLFLSNRVLQPLQQGLSVWTKFQYFKIAQNRFDMVQNMPLEKDHGLRKAISGAITFESVSFGYEGTEKNLYENTSLHIKAGEFITIVGKSGSGKTTLSQLLMGNITPTSGRILIDNTPLEELNMPCLRRQMAYLSPQGQIFNASVMENLTLFADKEQKQHAIMLAKKIGLDTWVMQLPHGYDTIIGNNLDNDLPGGIQQRLCLVRALLLSPQILILDEANTSLDMVGDAELMKLLKAMKGKLTIIFITHRPSVAKAGDRMLEIRDKTVVERSVS